MHMGGRKASIVAFALVALVAAGMAPNGVATGSNHQGAYEVPSSYRVAPVLGIPIFGIGLLTCDTGQAGDRDLATPTGVHNGACWTVDKSHDNHFFQVTAADSVFGGDVSILVTFDFTGDGQCQSPSCGVPEHARFSGCGTVSGTVPSGRAGTAVWVFVRAVDVNPLTGDLCLASKGELHGSF